MCLLNEVLTFTGSFTAWIESLAGVVAQLVGLLVIDVKGARHLADYLVGDLSEASEDPHELLEVQCFLRHFCKLNKTGVSFLFVTIFQREKQRNETLRGKKKSQDRAFQCGPPLIKLLCQVKLCFNCV